MKYEVTHTVLTSPTRTFRQGEIVEPSDLADHGFDVDFLVRNGAIEGLKGTGDAPRPASGTPGGPRPAPTTTAAATPHMATAPLVDPDGGPGPVTVSGPPGGSHGRADAPQRPGPAAPPADAFDKARQQAKDAAGKADDKAKADADAAAADKAKREGKR